MVHYSSRTKRLLIHPSLRGPVTTQPKRKESASCGTREGGVAEHTCHKGENGSVTRLTMKISLPR